MKQLLLLCIALYCSFNGYGQKKALKKTRPASPQVKEYKGNRLVNTSWSLVIDTSENGKTLTFSKIKNIKSTSCLIRFTGEKNFLLTVNTSDCIFKAEGTYTLNFIEAGTEGMVQLGPPNMLSFNHEKKLSRCAEQIMADISDGYSIGYYDESGFILEPLSPIVAPAGQ